MGQPTWPAYAALAALALVLSGCGDDESGTIPETSSTGASTSFLGTTTTTGPRAPAVRTSQSDAQFLMRRIGSDAQKKHIIIILFCYYYYYSYYYIYVYCFRICRFYFQM